MSVFLGRIFAYLPFEKLYLYRENCFPASSSVAERKFKRKLAELSTPTCNFARALRIVTPLLSI